jgi:uncharacterized protein
MLHRPLIDAFEFAASASRLSGDWPIADFPRLQGVVHSSQGTLPYSLQGIPQEQGRPALRLQVSGTLQLICQRCLGALEHPLKAEAVLLLFASESDMAALPVDAEGPDCIVGTKDMAVRDLIEDEVLLALPYAPHHEWCQPRKREEAPTLPGAFADLRTLLTKH